MPNTKTNNKERKQRDITIRLWDDEIADVADITKVDAVAPGVVAIVRTRIEEHRKAKA